MKYTTARAFRGAIEDTISNLSKKEGLDIQRLRRDVAFDRFLVRIFSMKSPPWALKGGYAMQLRTDSARTTKDVDLAVRDAKLFSSNESSRNEALREALITQANIELGDFFSFLISEPKQELDAAPEGGVRFLVEAQLDGRSFEKFHLDIGLGDVWSGSLETLDSSDILKFAGIESIKFPTISKEQQFAEKYHAYTLPRVEGRPNSRVKDLIDMNLLIGQGMNVEKLKSALDETFKRRATHELSLNPQPPPNSWAGTYKTMAEECGLDLDVVAGYKALEKFFKKFVSK